MFMSVLWDTIFDMNEKHDEISVFLIDNHIPALSFGNMSRPTVYLAGFGMDEWQTSAFMLRFFDNLVTAFEKDEEMAGVRVKNAMGEHGIILIPAVCTEKMKENCEKIGIKDLLPIAKYLRFHKVGMVFTACANGKSIACFEKNEKGGQSIGKILSACSKLPIDNEQNNEKVQFCKWVNEVIKIPSFNIALNNLNASSADYTYKSLEEMLLVSALI